MTKLPSGIVLVKLDAINWEPEYYPRNSVTDAVKTPAMIDVLRALDKKHDEKDARAHLLGNNGTDAPLTVRAPRGKDFTWLLLDGARRLHAYHRAGRTLFPVRKDTSIPESRYFLTATKLNITHGTRLSPYEIRRACQRLKEAGWKPTELPGMLDITPAAYKRMVTDKEVTRAVPGRVTRKHVGHLKTPFSGLTKIRERQLALDLQAPVATQSVQSAIDELGAFLEAGVFDGGEWNEQLEPLVPMLQCVLDGGKARDAA